VRKREHELSIDKQRAVGGEEDAIKPLGIYQERRWRLEEVPAGIGSSRCSSTGEGDLSAAVVRATTRARRKGNVCQREGVNRAKRCIPPTVGTIPALASSMRSLKTSWPLSWYAIGRTRHERVGFAKNVGTRIDFGGGQTPRTAVRNRGLR